MSKIPSFPHVPFATMAFCCCLLLCHHSFVHSFTPPSIRQLKSFITIVHFSSQSDFEGTIIGDDNEAGQALALEFSRELQARQTRALVDNKENLSQSNNKRLLSEEELRFLNNKPRRRRPQVISDSSSAGFFSQPGQSIYSVPLDLSPSRDDSDDWNLMLSTTSGPVSPLFLPTMAVLVALSVYLTFAVSATPDPLEVEDWNVVVKDVMPPVEQVVPPSVYL